VGMALFIPIRVTGSDKTAKTLLKVRPLRPCAVGHLLVVSEHFPVSSGFSLLVGGLRVAASPAYQLYPLDTELGRRRVFSLSIVGPTVRRVSVVAESSRSCSALGAVPAEWFRCLCCASRSSCLRHRRVPVDVLSDTRLQFSHVLPVDCYELALVVPAVRE